MSTARVRHSKLFPGTPRRGGSAPEAVTGRAAGHACPGCGDGRCERGCGGLQLGWRGSVAGAGTSLGGAWLAKAVGGLAAWPTASAGRPRSSAPPSPTVPGAATVTRCAGSTAWFAERIDDGVDFAGAGPVYALGDAVVTSAAGNNFGWPGGGWITYQLTSGPGVGLVVYVAEDIIPAVTVGQRVSPSTVIGTMFDGGDGIETGWAQPTGLSAESELPQAGAIGGLGPFPTRVGVNFDELLQSLGVPAAPNRTQTAAWASPGRLPSQLVIAPAALELTHHMDCPPP